MIADCRKVGLPEPDFEQNGPHFVVTLWRDWLTAEVLDHLELNDRQMLGVKTLKVERRITTMAYQSLVDCSRRTAARDLDELLKKGIIQRQGAGRSAYYLLARNRAINLPMMPSSG
jgi:ATP-dependent DNA helicase RecG